MFQVECFLQTDYLYDRDDWRQVEFPFASDTPSGVVESNDGAAFLGKPIAFLISLKQPPKFPNVQSVSARVISRFISKITRGRFQKLI